MGLVTDIKEVAELVQKADNIELYRRILDLQKEALEEQEGKLQLQARIRALEKRLDLGERLTARNNAYWLAEGDGSEDGPFCTVCWDQKDRLVRLHNVDAKGQGICHGCGTGTYYDSPGVVDLDW